MLWRRGCADNGGEGLREDDGKVLAMVDAELELGEVAMDVLVEPRGAIGAGQCGLQVAQEDVDALKAFVLSAGTPAAGDDGLMDARLLGRDEACQTVGDDRGGPGDMGAAELGHGREPVRDGRQTDAVRLAAQHLHRHDEWHLVLRASAGPAAGALSTQVRVIHLDAAGELPILLDEVHGLADLVLEHPGRGVEDAELAVQLQGRDAVLGGADQLHGQEPRPQRQLRVLQDSSDDQAALAAAAGAQMEQLATPAGRPRRIAAAARAPEAIRPALPGRMERHGESTWTHTPPMAKQQAPSTGAAPATAPGPALGLRIVGLGASAGGLVPLEEFLSHVPATSGMAYLVVQHMDPTHETLLTELLQRATPMPVREAVDGRPIERNSVYVIPPGTELTVLGGALRLTKPTEPRGQRLPIDALFGSLARELGDRAVGVVLSGMGSDGTVGLQTIHAQGGLAMAQEPASAQFDAMPRNAIASGCVAIIALPEDMPKHICGQLGDIAPTPAPPASSAGDPATALERILELVHGHTGHDLALYKSNTLERRIARREAVHGLPSMAAYADFLRANAQEIDLLFKEMLIGVTSFFRDPPVWQALQDRVLPHLLAGDAETSGPLRAWVVGCSTGEEAYTLAIACLELVDAAPGNRCRDIQIFATDLNADAIAAARSGRFPASVATDLTPERLARHFSASADEYQIDKRVRDRVLFAQHDVITDAPFTRLDLIVCRNVLIYFGAALQRRLIPLFHYSLRPGGCLLLGGSETTGRAQALFRPLEPKSRLYWRVENGRAAAAVDFPSQRRTATPSAKQENPLAPIDAPNASLQALADQWLLQLHSPPAVLVNEAGDVVYISGRTGRYLEPAAGKANWNIHVMARPAFRAQLAVALRQALQDKTSIELRDLRLDDEGNAAVDITVQAVVQPPLLAGMAMIVFRDVVIPAGRRRPRSKSAAAADAGVTEELLRSRHEIQALRQEMRASQEELQAANEELQSTNEELQSANEELTTSKEEAQSMNEELQTINGELQTKLDDLALAQSDMQNLLNSTDIATLFLDKQLNVRRYTEQMARVIPLRSGDIGRPLTELASTLLYPELHADVKETLRTLAFSEKQIATSDGHWFAVRIMPYRTLSDVIQGVVITFVDITVAKELESRLRQA